MKKFGFILLAAAIMFVSCSKELNVISTPEEEYVEIEVKTLLENVVFVSETPMTKAATSSNDLWGIQIFREDDWSKPHFCGLYDDISQLASIKFVKNVKYGIYANYMPNGKIENPNYGTGDGDHLFNTLAHNGEVMELNYGYYGSPSFQSFNGLCYCLISTFKTNEYYMFVNQSFVATSSETTLDINYQRANLGVSFTFEKDNDYTYDEIVVKMEHRTRPISSTVKLTNGAGTFSWPSLLIDHYDDMTDKYEVTLSIGTSEDPTQLYYGNITLAKNTVRNYTVKLTPISDSHSLNIAYSGTGNMNSESMGSIN